MSNNKGTSIAVVAIIIAAAGLGLAGYLVFFPSNGGVRNNMENVYYCSSATELQVAIDTIDAGNGLIMITNNITLDETIDIDNGGDYILQGAGAITIIVGGNFTGINISSASSFILKELTINMAAIISGTTPAVYIDEENNNPVHIQNIHFIGGVRGVFISSNQVWVERCVFDDLDYGVYIHTSYNSHILDNHINNGIESGIYITGSRYCVLTGNVIQYCDSGIYLGNSNNEITVANNIVRDIYAYGIRVYGSFICTIVGNTVSSQAGSIYTAIYGIYALSSSYNVFTGNMINDVKSIPGTGYGFYLEGSNYNVVTSNNMYENNINAVTEAGCTGNQIASCIP
ncbi:MAG: right-handed parallel beta-helix repeat-containing protein [Candidatus Lokiarchaeota archaeon]|nr:right-handed parallel beta-helix repeat-containing protein [Candidatus Lokiarchaeota archaeon]